MNRELFRKAKKKILELAKKHNTLQYGPLFASIYEYTGVPVGESEYSFILACENGEMSLWIDEMKEMVNWIKSGNCEYDRKKNKFIFLEDNDK